MFSSNIHVRFGGSGGTGGYQVLGGLRSGFGIFRAAQPINVQQAPSCQPLSPTASFRKRRARATREISSPLCIHEIIRLTLRYTVQSFSACLRYDQYVTVRLPAHQQGPGTICGRRTSASTSIPFIFETKGHATQHPSHPSIFRAIRRFQSSSCKVLYLVIRLIL